MRWLVGWSSVAASFATTGGARTGAANGPYGTGPAAHDAYDPYGTDRATAAEGRTVQPVGAQLLWGGPDPLWAVGDWRPDEVRVVSVDDRTHIAVLGCCAAGDDALRRALLTARGGALRHLTAWPGSYTAVVKAGRRITVTGDLAGPGRSSTPVAGRHRVRHRRPAARRPRRGPARHRPPGRPARLPRDPGGAARLHPYEGVRRVPPGHALILREGSREITGYEQVASLAVATPRPTPGRPSKGSGTPWSRPCAPGSPPPARARGPAPRPRPGPRHGARRPARRPGRGPGPGIGADLSGGSASGTLALLAAGLPGVPGTITGHGTGAGERLLAVTFNDLATRAGSGRADELKRARELAADPRLHHVVVAAGEEACRTPPWTGRSPTSRGPRSSLPNGTGGGSRAAAPTTSPAWAPSRSWTRTRRASPTS